mmetsp:Transcript_76358/g.181583  ORF Transcript_76358/g.181583 Transcript_76358/m.181583 type:complete len:259 (+) Transcript_76358:73-849(+)
MGFATDPGANPSLPKSNMATPLAPGSVSLSKDTGSTAPGSPGGAQGYASAAVSRAAERAAQDPQVQAAVAEAATTAATSVAASALQSAQARVVRGASEAMRYIQMGGTGISTLCTISAFATICITLISMFGVLGSLVTFQLATYTLNVYMFFFGWIALLLEADLDRLAAMPLLGKVEPCVRRRQQFVHQEVHIITGLKGRGFFYIFMGVLGVVQGISLTFLCGLLNLFSGTMCISAACSNPPPPTADSFLVQAAHAGP